MFRLTDDDVADLFSARLTNLLASRPQLRPAIFRPFADTFATKEEVAAVLEEIQSLRVAMKTGFEDVDQRFEQVDQRFEQVDQCFEQVDQRFEQVDQRFEQMDQRFEQVDQRFEQVDQRLQGVDQRFVQVDERFDRLEARMEAGFLELHRAIDRLGGRWGIRNESIFRQTVAALLEASFGVQVEQRWIEGEQFDCIIFDGQHILVEIAASVGPKIQERLERKREVYIRATGVRPVRFILATGSIHSRRAMVLRQAGFEVIEPEEEALVG